MNKNGQAPTGGGIDMILIFYLLGLSFYRSRGKASMFIAGYNTKTEEEKKNYDEVRMCRDYGRRMMFWAVPFLVGMCIDVWKEGAGCTLAWAVYAVLLIWHVVDICRNGDKRYRREAG